MLDRPLCQKCGINVAKKSGKPGHYRAKCSSCSRNGKLRSPKLAYRLYKKDYCEDCGFRGIAYQLDIDHIDGDRTNNDPSNLRTRCANCHRLKTFLSKEHLNIKYRRNNARND